MTARGRRRAAAILALIVFLTVKQLDGTRTARPPAAPSAPPEEVMLLREIRDAVRTRRPGAR